MDSIAARSSPTNFLSASWSKRRLYAFCLWRVFSRRGMMAQQSGSAMTGKPLIESDRVEGTTVYDPSGNNIGSVKRLMIEKISGRVAYAVMSFGGFLGMGTEEHSVPWNKLTYDTNS